MKVAKTREDLRQLWGRTDGCPAKEQKPLFRPETEVEKCISFFETLTPLHFAAEMLCAALEACVGIAESGVLEVLQWAGDDEASPCTCASSRDCPRAIKSAVLQDLALLREDGSALLQYQEDVPSLLWSRATQEETRPCPSRCCLHRRPVQSFDKLEDFEAKARTLHNTFLGPAAPPVQQAGRRSLSDSESSAMVIALAFSCSSAYAHRSSQCPVYIRPASKATEGQSQEDVVVQMSKCRAKDLL